ncbi:hypothetical protein OIV83_001739, partial [Microbotryomycetes sp. JL201]
MRPFADTDDDLLSSYDKDCDADARGAPSPQLCIETAQYPTAWYDKLKSGQSPWMVHSVDPDELRAAVIATRAQHDTKGKDKAPLQSTDPHRRHIARLESTSEVGLSSNSLQAVDLDGSEYEGDEVWNLEGLHPPPTQDSTRFTQTIHPAQSLQYDAASRSSAVLANVSILLPSQPLHTQYEDTFNSVASVGPPPRFAWNTADLVQFDKFRHTLRTHAGSHKPSVSFLAAVIDMRDAKTLSSGKQVGEWDLIDTSGQAVKMNIWGSGADDVTALVRRGDIIFVDNAKLSQYKSSLQVSVNHDRGPSLKGWGLQIVWRTNVASPEDYQHRFDEELRGQGLAQVDLVLDFVDWYMRWKGVCSPARATVHQHVERASQALSTLRMPPKKRAESPAASDAESNASTSSTTKKPVAKKAKKQKEPVTPLDKSLPTNKQLPDELTPIPARHADAIRISAWNVCGIKSCEKKGLCKYLEAEDADLVVLTETKTDDPKFAWIDEHYPVSARIAHGGGGERLMNVSDLQYRYWGVDGKKGYAGTAILSKLEPKGVTMGLPTSKQDQKLSEGRIITLEFDNTYVIGTYVPNAGEGLKNLDKKVEWNEAFEEYLRQLDAKKPVIWTGDLNVIPTELDIRNWKTNYNKSPGVTQKEIDAFKAQLNPKEDTGHAKLVDVWRHMNPELEGHYSYFSRRFDCRTKGIGWRLDFAVVSERLMDKVKACEIRHEI